MRPLQNRFQVRRNKVADPKSGGALARPTAQQQGQKQHAKDAEQHIEPRKARAGDRELSVCHANLEPGVVYLPRQGSLWSEWALVAGMAEDLEADVEDHAVTC